MNHRTYNRNGAVLFFSVFFVNTFLFCFVSGHWMSFCGAAAFLMLGIVHYRDYRGCKNAT